MEYEVGIDEAGRGPVIGPMVYACCAWPISLRETYSKKGFDDSKKLTEVKRDMLFDVIKSLPEVVYKTDVLSPEYISNCMLGRQKISLNVISMESAEKLIQELINDGINVREVYVDTVGTAESYQERLSNRFSGIQFKVSAKADSLFPIVSAASIVAKVTRDSFIEDYKNFLGEIGSGYPSDPNTQGWLKKNMNPVFGYPSKFVRISWRTCTDAMQDLPLVSWPEEMSITNERLYYFENIGTRDKFP